MSPKIDELSHALNAEFGLTPVMGGEIECYVMLANESGEAMDAFWKPVDTAFKDEGLPILRIEKERGYNQYEIVTGVTTPQNLAATLMRVRALIERQAKTQGVTVHFGAKPFVDQPSSGMHLHLHLADANGVNQFHKTEEWTSDYLRFSIAGLLNALNDALPVFFPNPEDYTRLDDADHVPKIAGWGYNNRYCALRIPMHPDPYDKRIEHRVPCANADPEAAIATMMEGVLKGLREKIEPPEQSYGKFVRAVAS